MKITEVIKTRYSELKEYLSNEIYDEAKVMIYNTFKLDSNKNTMLYSKSEYPVLDNFDKEITITAILFAENEIKIDPEIKTFDIWIDFRDNTYAIQGFAPPVDSKNRDEYILELSKHLRDLIDLYTFDSISRMPKTENITDYILFEISRYYQNTFIYGFDKNGQLSRNDKNFEIAYTKSDIKILKSILAKILQIGTGIDAKTMEKIIESIENQDINTVNKLLPKHILNKITPLVKNFGKLDVEYFELFKNLIPENSLQQLAQILKNNSQTVKNNKSNTNGNNKNTSTKQSNDNDNTGSTKNSNNTDNSNLDAEQLSNLIRNTGLTKYFMMNENPDQTKKHESFKTMIQDKLKETLTKHKGSMPGSVSYLLSKILKIKINWTEIFERILGSRLELSYTKSWHIPRKHLIHLVYLPGYRTEQKINNIGILIDTSGSMSDLELSKALGIIYDLAISYQVKTITVFQHDYELQRYDIYSVDMLQTPKDILRQIKITGRGGTSHVNPVKKIFKLLDTGEIEDMDLLIIFSDFESDFEDAHKLLEKRQVDYICITTYKDLPYIDKRKYPVIKVR